MLHPLNRQTAVIEKCFPERIVRFGGGNFLRGFVDWMVENLNAHTGFAGSVVIVKPTPHGSYQMLDEQDTARLRQIQASGASTQEIAGQTLSNQALWGTDLNELPGFVNYVSTYPDRLTNETIENLLLECNHQP